MNVADVFVKWGNIEDFRREVRSCDGKFNFGPDEMTALAEVYFKCCPDSFNRRDLEAVKLGYDIARTCLVEKALEGAVHRRVFRAMFDSVSSIDDNLHYLEKQTGAKALLDEVLLIEGVLFNYKNIIETLPHGMVRERYAGGISALFNIVFIIKSWINKKMSSP